MKLHKSITIERVTSAVRESMFDLSNPGFCIACGENVEGTEPDMSRGRCPYCSAFKVYGAEELLMYL